MSEITLPTPEELSAWLSRLWDLDWTTNGGTCTHLQTPELAARAVAHRVPVVVVIGTHTLSGALEVQATMGEPGRMVLHSRLYEGRKSVTMALLEVARVARGYFKKAEEVVTAFASLHARLDGLLESLKVHAPEEADASGAEAAVRKLALWHDEQSALKDEAIEALEADDE